MIATCLLPFFSVLPLGAPLGDSATESTHAVETYVLDNGMRITLYVDRSLPKVVVDTWFAVGSKDEEPGRSGFAHLFEHLMFMGTERVPGGQFDVIMEEGGGFNNASTSQDITNYFSVGPSSLLPTLLWLDADRFAGLDDAMTVEKLDLQRDVVRNERRETENQPYGRSEFLLPELLYPAGHPYRHTVIGSHADLEAAELADVVGFFNTYYVPGNASVVVAGDFDPAQVKPLIERTLGAVPPAPLPQLVSAPPVRLGGETRATTYDEVEHALLSFVWLSPPALTAEDGALDVAAAILAGGTASRLYERLVIETGLAQEVDSTQSSGELSSEFHVDVIAAPGADLEELERETLAVVADFARAPRDEAERSERAAELARVQAQIERDFHEGMEDLFARADAMNRYLHHWGTADGFARDLARWTEIDAEDVRRAAAAVFAGGKVALRVLPAEDERETGTLADVEGEAVREWKAGGSLDERPDELAASAFAPPVPLERALSNGIPVHLVPRPGTRLFAGTLFARGGESRVPPAEAGLAELTARVMSQGAAGLDAVAWAEAVESLGAEIDARAGREDLRVSVRGISSRVPETIARFAELALAPNLAAEDFEREQELLLGEIAARADEPRAVAALASRALLFGPANHRGRPVTGTAATIGGLELRDVRGAHPALIDGQGAHAQDGLHFVFAGDFEVDALLALLEEHFAELGSPASATAREASGADDSADVAPLAEVALAPPLRDAPPGRFVLVDRPGAPQTVIHVLRPLALASDEEQALRTVLDLALGGSFTSRLNQNLREKNGYAYGAGSRISREGEQVLFTASTSVQTEVTGPALRELLGEIERLGTGDLAPAELEKAVASARTDAVERLSTTGGVAQAFTALLAEGRPLGALARDLAQLERAELAAANELARSGLYDRSKLQVVLVGDAEQVLPQLEKEGFAAPLRADAEGRLID